LTWRMTRKSGNRFSDKDMRYGRDFRADIADCRPTVNRAE
jgi:hypothetical protein